MKENKEDRGAAFGGAPNGAAAAAPLGLFSLFPFMFLHYIIFIFGHISPNIMFIPYISYIIPYIPYNPLCLYNVSIYCTNLVREVAQT